MKWIYFTRWDPKIFWRPLLFVKCCSIPIYYTNEESILNMLLPPNKILSRQMNMLEASPNSKPFDPLKFIYDCYSGRRLLLTALVLELIYANYLVKIDKSDGCIVMNPYGFYASKISCKKNVLDLMDFISCQSDAIRFNAIDFTSIKKADHVLVWSKAIEIVLRTKYNIKHVTYLPFGVDLDIFDPLKVPPSIILERYPELREKFKIVYSGGLFKMNGVDVSGLYKLIKAFKLLERSYKNVILILQTSKEVMKYIANEGVKNFLYIPPTTSFNDPLRLSLLRSADILVLTGSRHPTVYLAERTTMYQYMASGNAILAEGTMGVKYVLDHLDTAYIVDIDNPQKLAEGIAELLKDESLRKYIGMRARSLLERRYSWTKLTRDAKNILENISL